jgi:hypothetical protein
MKKKLSLFIVLIVMTLSFGQKKYSFDYMIEYNYKTEQSVVTKQFIITNSIDDSYIIYATEIGNGNLNVYFRDLKGVRSSFVLKKTDLIKAETITLDCNLVYEQDFKKEDDSRRFSYGVNKDTIIENQNYKMYTLKFKKKWEAKKHGKGTIYYIVEPNTEFHLPLNVVVFDHTVIFDNLKILNVIPKEIFTIDRKSNEKIVFYKLLSLKKINKYVILPKECNYTNP